ncbi:SDR family oxidoreductase [Bacillus timonensis]|nr:SDR family oxidoreductase [Bacillus timonensis]
MSETLTYEKELHGKVILITGGTRGIGAATASLLASHGACVISTSRQAPKVDGRFSIRAGEIREVFLDVTQEESVTHLFQIIHLSMGKIDVVINNAGIGLFKSIEETTLKEWQDIMDTNVTGVFLCCREAFKLMKTQGGGRIINIASVAGYIPLPYNSGYGTSKYAIRGFSSILNEEGKHDNIRVSVVSPGATLTEMTAGIEGLQPEDMLKPEDVADSIFDIARRPLHVRIDEVKILPPKGIL